MKNKPVRHKETNTFKFKKFSERISEIDVDVFHRVAHRNEEYSDDEESLETNFYRTLQKWNVLNLTEGYKSFRKEVHQVVTLPQLLKHKQEVLDSLTKYLRMRNATFVQPILDLVVAAAKDLQKDFYEHFPHFLSLIIDLLSTKDPEILEYSFTTLAYLFKFLWRYLIKNIDGAFQLLLPLLVDTKPEYVNNFAAESFAFVARKVRDREAFLKLVFEALKKCPDGTVGCGKLLFEVISGISGQFHSCAEHMLTLYLNALVDDSMDGQLVFEVIQQVFVCITNSIIPKNSQPLWSILFKFLDQQSTAQEDKNKKLMILILKLSRLIIDHRGGKMLINPVEMKSKIVKIIPIYDGDVLKEAVDLSIDILLANNLKLTQEVCSEFVIKLLSIRSRELLRYIVKKLADHSSFETLILPMALQRSVLKEEFGDNELELFSEVINARAPPSLGGIDSKSWRKMNLDIRGFPATTFEYLHNKLKNWETENGVSEESLLAAVILPHVTPTNSQLVEELKNILVSMYNKLIEDHYMNMSSTEIEKRGLAFLLILESTTHLVDTEDFQKFIEASKIDVLELLKKYSHVSSILKSADLFLTFIKNSEQRNLYVNEKIFAGVNEYLGRHLCSPYGKIRLTVSHIYSLFSDVEELFIEKNDEGMNALSLLFAAESVETTVYNYRDRLIHLQALTFTSRALTNLKPEYQDFPVKFLIGNLYINFSLLWDPTAKAIATFASERCPHFWQIFLEDLRSQSLPPAPDIDSEFFNSKVLKTLTQKLSPTDKPDLQNHKILLWKCMSDFPEYVESKNREVTVLFIDFVETTIFKSNSETAKSYNLLKHDSSEDAALIDENDSEDEEGTTKEAPRSQVPKKSALKKLGRSSDFKLLLAQLSLFAKANNPKMMYRESEMYQIYLDLLTSKSVELQKAVLDCLFSYKHKFLMPYKDHLYGLIEEKNLRNELARFKIEHEEDTTTMIQEDHRNALMPILMRLVYAKMISRGAGRAAGAAGGLVRRKIILRFLMGVKETEMMFFTKMAFKPFEKYQISLSPEDSLKDLKELIADVLKNLDLSEVIPPKRLRSAVTLLSIIIEEFGAKMSSNLLPRLLALLLCIMAHIKGILEQQEKIFSGFVPMVKDLKNTCTGILGRFFGHFENYNWSETELDVLFDVAVFPWLEKLPVEGVHSPTALLKLLSAWCQNPRYFCLLVKHAEGNKGLSPLPFVVKLLLRTKTHPSVSQTILDMLEKLMTLQDYGVITEDQMDVDDVKIPLKPTNLLDVNAAAILPGIHINYGSSILLPHVPDILSYIKRKFQKSKSGINRTETSILARISELDLDPETSNSLVSLSLPILVKRAMKGEAEETILELLTTIANLMKNVQEPHVHLRAILPLLSCVGSSAARKLLLQLFKTIASKDCESSPVPRDIMVKTADLLGELNAMDQRWIDQPDFERRLDAFSEIKSAISSENPEQSKILTIEFGVAVLYSCFYFLKRETDLSLRDSAGLCLNILGPELAKRNKDNKVDRMFLIEETILNLVRTGIRSKNEAVRLRSISFLGVMSMECPDVHPVLRDLNLLTDKVDPEVDFFENLQHLQLHRKARAFLKFCTMSKALEKAPNSKTLTQFIFPLASSYLCNESFANKNSLVDAAIETVGAVCRLLPWHQYAIILKYYLDKLRSSTDFQKQIVRTVIAILDAFHYDLSKLKTVEEVMKSEDKCDIEQEPVQPAEDSTEVSTPEIAEESEETLDEALNKEEASLENQKVPEDPEVDQTDPKKFVEKLTILSPYAAKGVVFDITNTLLPQLHRSILARTHHELSHKVNRRRTGAEKEEEELMRVPIALALVKLLQKLPERILDKNLPGIFMKLCTFLKSRLESVRRSTREILQKVMITLGPDYLHHLLREMNSLLTRGFQIHVLAYTIHAVLISLKPFFKESHVNENLQSILQVCKVDLFGLSAEEKDIAAVTKNTSEAKSTKSFDIFHVLGQFITEGCLVDLLQPLVTILNDSRSHKTVRKVVECLRHTVLGLADNAFIPPDKLLIFLYGVVSKSIPALNTTRPKSTQEEKPQNKTQVSDCFIIPAEPKSRMGLKMAAKTSGDTNDHILLEFALKLLHILLKREKVTAGSFKQYLNPFVPILSDCLNSPQVKMNTLSLQCLNWVIKMDLDSVRSLITEICASIFKILHKYGAAGLSKGDNFDLVMAAFKSMSVLVRDVKHFDMSDDQVKALILYAEQDLHDYERQATAFNLLKAVINRKLIIPEMHEVMKKVAVLSVTSDSENVRQQARGVFYAFLMEYPLGKDLEKHLSFYLSQLSYEVQPGRMSALNMILSIVTGFPEAILIQQSSLIFIMAGARLVNDEDPDCKKLTAKCIKEVITRVPHNQRIKLFDIVITWFKSPQVSLRRLAAQLCGIFVTVEKDSFETRLEEVLSLVLKQFRLDEDQENGPGKFVKTNKKKIMEDVKDPERLKDHHLFQVLQLTLKISANCSAFLKSEKYIESVHSLGKYSQENLGHPHLWVRLAATQQIGFILATLDDEKLSRHLQIKEADDAEPLKGYVYSAPGETLRSLSLDLLAQLQPGMEFEELADQVVKNLVFIARVIRTSSWGEGEEKDDGVSLLWLVKRVRKCVNIEVTQNPKSTCVRSAAFKWTAGVVTTIPMDPYLKPILFQLMSPLVREMLTTEESNAPLRQLSKEVGRMIKKRMDDDEYAKLLARVQQKLDIKRAERKKTLTQQYVVDPELAAKKKIAKQQKKKEAKKRKRSEIQGKRKRDKRPRKEVDVEIM